VLFPSAFYRFFFKFGDYSLTTLLKVCISAFFAVMAFWSHWNAGPPVNPGWLEWEHFRSEEELKDKSSKMKWQDPAYRRQKLLESKQQDPENVDVNSLVCLRCGCIKVDGVHHCGPCGRCVYKMDHHCPWTNNCVGYYTIKPFLLFLFYVTCLTYVTVLWMYMAAWD
jgi:hypothetical protein